jgi:hypothetical protein
MTQPMAPVRPAGITEAHRCAELSGYQVGEYVTFVHWADVTSTVRITALGTMTEYAFSDGEIGAAPVLDRWLYANSEEIARCRDKMPAPARVTQMTPSSRSGRPSPW